MGKKKAGARKAVRKHEYDEVIPAKKKRGPPLDRDAPHTCAAEGPAATSGGARAHSTAFFVV